MGTQRSDKKMKTYAHSVTYNRHEEVHEIPSKDLAELYRLQDEIRKNKSDKPSVDTTEASLKAAWGKDSWLVFAELPVGTKERAMHVRKFKYVPSSEKIEAAFMEWPGACVNTKGQKSPTDATIGQDQFSIAQLDDKWEAICVMDGHGPGGHWPSTRAVQTVPFFLQETSCKTMLKQGRVDAAITHAFKQCQEDLEYRSRQDNVDIQVAGCTAVCIVRHPRRDKIWVGTSGDSRCIMFIPGDEDAIQSTVDHKPSHETEKARVEAAGCEVTRTEYEDGWVEERVNIRGREYPGISMTRSLGDLLVKAYGVIAEPVVVEWPRVKGAYLLAASDGVWEFLENDEVISVISKELKAGKSPAEACKTLLKVSREAWREHEGIYCDDITMVLVPIDKGFSAGASETSCCAGCTLQLKLWFLGLAPATLHSAQWSIEASQGRELQTPGSPEACCV